MNQSPPETLEVHVSFEANRFGSVYLTDAYELLTSIVPERKPAAAEAPVLSSFQNQTAEKKAV
jgi:hypothetical protein